MSFSCPNFDMEREACLKLGVSCVPGRPGCVLRGNSVFAVPVEVRLQEREGGGGEAAGTVPGGLRAAETGAGPVEEATIQKKALTGDEEGVQSTFD